MIKYVKVSDMHFVGCVLHNFTFHDHFMPFLCTWFATRHLRNHVKHVSSIPRDSMSSKLALRDSYMYQNK